MHSTFVPASLMWPASRSTGGAPVIRKRFDRVATVFTSAILVLMLVGAGTVSAATPDWFITIVPTPDEVGAGHDAGFVVTVGNDGPSQVNALSVTVKALDTPGA